MWQPIETAPIFKPVLLWNYLTQEMVIGHKPDDAPEPCDVVVNFTAACADLWHPLPDEPVWDGEG